MRAFARIILTLSAAAAVGCWHEPQTVSNPDPADKIPAMKAAVQKDDRDVIPQIITDLGNDDPAVRLYAIEALRRLTGQDFGYQYFADEDHRKPAIERWKEWQAKQPR
jgi:hypothetical protein